MTLLDKLKQVMSPSGRRTAADTIRSDKSLDTRIAIASSCMVVSVVALILLSYQDSQDHNQSMAYSVIVLEQKIISQNIAINAQGVLSRERRRSIS